MENKNRTENFEIEKMRETVKILTDLGEKLASRFEKENKSIYKRN